MFGSDKSRIRVNFVSLSHGFGQVRIGSTAYFSQLRIRVCDSILHRVE